MSSASITPRNIACLGDECWPTSRAASTKTCYAESISCSSETSILRDQIQRPNRPLPPATTVCGWSRSALDCCLRSCSGTHVATKHWWPMPVGSKNSSCLRSELCGYSQTQLLLLCGQNLSEVSESAAADIQSPREQSAANENLVVSTCGIHCRYRNSVPKKKPPATPWNRRR